MLAGGNGTKVAEERSSPCPTIWQGELHGALTKNGKNLLKQSVKNR